MGDVELSRIRAFSIWGGDCILAAMRRVLFFPSLVLLVMGVLCYLLSAQAGDATGAAVRGGVHRPVTFAIADDIKTLDPGKMSWVNDIRVAMGLWEGLCAYDPETLAPVPGVAASFTLPITE